jgi:hypothetical protein
MKTVMDSATRKELIERIHSLSPQHTAHWGKMNVHQMLEHCTRCDDMYHGELKIRRVLIGRLFGSMFKKKILKKDLGFGKNSPTSPLLLNSEAVADMDALKQAWQNRIEQYGNFKNHGFVHPFFGSLTTEEVGVFAYKHADHHLRQFGA